MDVSQLQNQVDRVGATLSGEGKELVTLLMGVIVAQDARIKALEDQLSKHSGNSSKPPSQDIFRTPKARSLRKGSGKSPGGQPGHQGKGGQLKGNADCIVEYPVAACPACGVDLSTTPADYIICKQIEDLPPIKTFVEEHRIQVKTCPCCQQQWKAQGCPAHVQHSFAYGPRVKALAIYLSAFQFIPAQRTKQLMATLGVVLSTGSLDNFRQAAGRELGAFQDALRKCVLTSAAAFFDETGVKVQGIGHWVHVACTARIAAQMFSLFMLHPKRGRKAHQDMAVLADFQGGLAPRRLPFLPYL